MNIILVHFVFFFSKEIHWYLNGTLKFIHSENAILRVLGEAEIAVFNSTMLTLKEKQTIRKFESVRV